MEWGRSSYWGSGALPTPRLPYILILYYYVNIAAAIGSLSGVIYKILYKNKSEKQNRRSGSSLIGFGPENYAICPGGASVAPTATPFSLREDFQWKQLLVAVSRPLNRFSKIALFNYFGCIFGKFCQICSQNTPKTLPNLSVAYYVIKLDARGLEGYRVH